MKWYLIVNLTWISLIINEADHLFMCSLANFIYLKNVYITLAFLENKVLKFSFSAMILLTSILGKFRNFQEFQENSGKKKTLLISIEEEKLKFYITSFSFCLCNSACPLQSLDHVGRIVSESGDLQYQELEFISLTLVLLKEETEQVLS